MKRSQLTRKDEAFLLWLVRIIYLYVLEKVSQSKELKDYSAEKFWRISAIVKKIKKENQTKKFTLQYESPENIIKKVKQNLGLTTWNFEKRLESWINIQKTWKDLKDEREPYLKKDVMSSDVFFCMLHNENVEDNWIYFEKLFIFYFVEFEISSILEDERRWTKIWIQR